MISYLFDVDGVLTNPQKMDEINSEVFPYLMKQLQEGGPIGFISGRGMIWLRAKLIKAIEKYVEKQPTLDKTILDLIYVSGEFGGVTCIHKDAVRQESINRDLILPEDVKRGLHLVAFQYSEYIYIETEKQTIFTSVKNHSIKDEDFQSRKKTIIEEYQQVIAPYPDLEVQSDRVSINVRFKKANKSYATDQFLLWLKEKGIASKKYLVFGDSSSDLEMGVELQHQQLPFEFIFVGEESELGSTKPAFPLTITKGHCDQGTIEYLSTH